MDCSASLSNHFRNRLTRWQIIVIATVFIAYMLHYFCKVHLYVVLNDFKAYISPNQQKAETYTGIMLSLGYIAYASGKIILGIFIDSYLKSALKAILITLILAPIFSILFALISPENETLRVTTVYILWFGIRFVIASAWIGLVKLVANWIPPTHHGRVMAFCNLSWLFGDSAARAALGFVYKSFDDQWRSVFYVSSVVTAIAIIPTLIFIRDSPLSRGLSAVDDTSDNVYAKHNTKLESDTVEIQIEKETEDNDHGSTGILPMSVVSNEDEEIVITAMSSNTTKMPKTGFCQIFKPLLREPLFFMVLLLNFQYLFMRELYNIFFIAI